MLRTATTKFATRRAVAATRTPVTTAYVRTAAVPRTALVAQRCFAQSAASQPPKAAANAAVPDASNAAFAAVANANANANANNSNNGSEQEPPKYKPGWFSRNPGITLGGIVLAIGLYLYRGSRNKKNFDAVQTPLAEAAVISPYEAWELRSANDITPETYEAVRAGVVQAFPSGRAVMEHFDQYLGFKLVDACPNGLRNAHHLERVLLSLERDASKKIAVDALMVAFSMAVKGAVDDRLQCLFDLATESTAPADENVDDTREITQQQFERLLALLLETYQIPSEKRVLPVPDAQYPFQQYKAATPHELLDAAVQAQVDAKKLSAADATKRDTYTFEAFNEIMRGKTVCLWGECFANAKKRMKN